MLGLADHYVSPSHFLADRYVEWGIDGERMSVIENGLAIDEAAPPRQISGPDARRSRFAFFGQLTPFKGADVLLDAITRVPESVWGDDARLMIFGGNLERQPLGFQEKITELVKRAGPRARFYGALPEHRDAAPHASRGLGRSCRPSGGRTRPSSSRKPSSTAARSSASNIGGMAEKIRDGVDGMHFRVGSAEDLADRLVDALTDNTLWDRLRAGIEPPPSYLDCAREHLELYRRCIEQRAPARERGRGVFGLTRNEPPPTREGRYVARTGYDPIWRGLRPRQRPLVQLQGHPAQHRPLPQHRRRIRLRFLAEAPAVRQAGVLPIANPDMSQIDRLREEYDYVFLRGSNYIHQHMKWSETIAVLKRLKLPVLGFGIGAQAPVEGAMELSEETKTVLRMMADSTTSIGVRGAYTAQVLWDLGIRNVRIVGCPTAFRRNDPDLAIRLPPLDEVRNVGVTLRREVSPAYAKDIRKYLTFHRDLVKALAARFDVVLMAQGEVEEKKLVFGTEEQREEAIAALKANSWVSSWYLDDAMEQLYRTRLFYSDVVADYENLVREKDFVLGYRLHGNLMALSNAVPSVYFTYDSRTVEFAETYQIPSYDVFSDTEFRLEDYWDQALFDRFNRAWHYTYREMQAFLAENGVPNKMVDVTTRPHGHETARRVA